MSTGLAFPDGVDTLIGKVVQGRFQVEKRIAAGGMGVVYRAIQLPLGRPVAFKVLELAMGASDPSFQRRFFLEASAAAKLSHPNTIVVHDYGRTDEGARFVANSDEREDVFGELTARNCVGRSVRLSADDRSGCNRAELLAS